MSASVTEPTTTTWSIDPAHTVVEFAIKHLMIATVKGHFGGVEGTLELDETDPTAARLEVSVDAGTVTTRSEQRDGHLRSGDFFDVERYPTIGFVGKRVRGDLKGKFQLTCDLTIRGVTREITLDVTNEGRARDPWGGDRAIYSATGKIRRADWGLTWNQALEQGGVLVSDDVRISVEVQLVQQG